MAPGVLTLVYLFQSSLLLPPRVGAHMSDIEHDTMAGTVRRGRGGGDSDGDADGQERREERPLKELYDFGPRPQQQQQRKRLHIMEEKTRIVDLIQSNRVSVITGATGCGKTTQVPQFILDHYAEHKPASRVNIVVTQPRRIAAVSVANQKGERRRRTFGVWCPKSTHCYAQNFKMQFLGIRRPPIKKLH